MVEMLTLVMEEGVHGLSFLRIVRLQRLVRVLRLLRTFQGVHRIVVTFGRALKNSLRSKNLGYAMMRNDFLTESILRILGPIGGIKRAMECDRPLWVL